MKFALLILWLIISGVRYPVIQQVGHDASWVSRLPDALTQFNRGTGLGFLAHNYLAGRAFAFLRPGDEIVFIDSENNRHPYRVVRLYEYEHIGHDLFRFADTGAEVTGAELLAAMYQPGILTLQTCISQGGDDEWGRLFVRAKPFETQNHHQGRNIYVPR